MAPIVACLHLFCRHLCPLTTSVHSPPLSTHHLCPLVISVHSSPLFTRHLCSLATSVHSPPLSTHYLCPLITSVHSPPMSSPHLCLLVTFLYLSLTLKIVIFVQHLFSCRVFDARKYNFSMFLGHSGCY